MACVAVAVPGAACGDDAPAPSSPPAEVERQGDPAGDRGGAEKSIEEFGEEAAGVERASIAAAFSGYLGGVATGDSQVACARLAAAVHESLEALVVERFRGAGCVAILPELLSGAAASTAREQAEGEITRIRVEGDRGFVVFRAPGAKLYQMTMVREGGTWKVATLSSSVLVPDL